MITGFVRNRSGLALVEFAILSPVVVITMIIGISFGVHVTKRSVFDRAIDAKAEIFMMSSSPDLIAVAKKSVSMIYRFTDGEYVTFVYDCTIGSSPACTEIPSARSGSYNLANMSDLVNGRVASFPVSLPAGENFLLVGGYLDDQAGRIATGMLLQPGPLASFPIVVVPVRQ